MLFQEMKRSNLKQESDSGKLVESSVLLGLMTSIKTKFEVAMYLKDHEKIGELTHQLDKYEQEYRQLQPDKNLDKSSIVFFFQVGKLPTFFFNFFLIN
jgi:uncharacterized protein (DUF342 family)